MRAAKPARLTFIAEPEDKPLRMGCRHCGAKPGSRCKDRRGNATNLYCDTRWHDLKQLREAEAKLNQWNLKYGKAEA